MRKLGLCSLIFSHGVPLEGDKPRRKNCAKQCEKRRKKNTEQIHLYPSFRQISFSFLEKPYKASTLIIHEVSELLTTQNSPKLPKSTHTDFSPHTELYR